jgi:cytochrome c553
MSQLLERVVAFFRLRIVQSVLFTIAGLIAVAFALLYGLSAWRLNTTYEVRPSSLTQSMGSVERGKRWGNVVGCLGCHGESGNVLFEADGIARVVAPNITRVIADYSDGELDALIRQGVKRDGTSLVIMPSDAYSNMSDADTADLIAWLRSLPQMPDKTGLPETSYAPLGRMVIIMGGLPISAKLEMESNPPAGRPMGAQQGEYLTKVTCLHCHRLETEHQVTPDVKAPALRAVVQGYDAAQLMHLLRSGKAAGDREAGMMSEVARSDLKAMTDEEIIAVFNYVSTLPIPEPTE